jgi:hypothetical protein
VAEDSELTSIYLTLRIEVVPENQRHEGDYKYLLPIAYGYWESGTSFPRTKGYPFFFPVLEGEVFSDTKQRLISVIGWESSEGVTYRFNLDRIASWSEISDDTILSEVGTDKSTLVVISKVDAKPASFVSGRSSDQAVHIYN